MPTEHATASAAMLAVHEGAADRQPAKQERLRLHGVAVLQLREGADGDVPDTSRLRPRGEPERR